MSITYAWNIKELTTKTEINEDGDTFADSIIDVNWEKTGTDSDNNIGRASGHTTLSASKTPKSAFKLLSNVTKEDVLGWIKFEGKGLNEDFLDTRIQEKINELKNPTKTLTTMPWET